MLARTGRRMETSESFMVKGTGCRLWLGIGARFQTSRSGGGFSPGPAPALPSLAPPF